MSILSSRGAAAPQGYGFLNYVGAQPINGGPGLWMTGLNDHGQLGLGDTTDRNILTRVGNDLTWTQLALGGYYTVPTQAGYGYSIALKSNGTIWATGANNYGQLGLGDTTDRNTFTQIGSDTNWAYISASNYTTYGIKTDGTLWAWGRNNVGQFGNGTLTSSNVPIQIGSSTNWSKVYAGGQDVYVLNTSGNLYVAGANTYGELGLGDTTYRSTLTLSSAFTDWVKFTLNNQSVSGLRSNGTIYSCGYNATGILGIGNTTSPITTWTQVGSDTDWADIGAVYGNNLLALKTNTNQYACGIGSSVIGNNPATNLPYWNGIQSSLIQLTGVGYSGYTKIISGTLMVGRLSTNGKIYITGANYFGQLGVNTPLYTSGGGQGIYSPSIVSGYNGWTNYSNYNGSHHIGYIG